MSLIDRPLTEEEKEHFKAKPYDFCHICRRFSSSCEGANPLAMEDDRLVEWLAGCAKYRNASQTDIATGSGIAIGTIHNIFSGRTKDMRVSTLRSIMRFLLGNSWGNPCHHARKFLDGDTTDEERVASLEKELEKTRKKLAAALGDLESLRADNEKKIKHLDEEVAHLREECSFKNSTIIWLRNQVDGGE